MNLSNENELEFSAWGDDLSCCNIGSVKKAYLIVSPTSLINVLELSILYLFLYGLWSAVWFYQPFDIEVSANCVWVVWSFESNQQKKLVSTKKSLIYFILFGQIYNKKNIFFLHFASFVAPKSSLSAPYLHLLLFV